MTDRSHRPEFKTDAERIRAARRYLKFACKRLGEARYGDQTKTADRLRIAERWRERAGALIAVVAKRGA